MTNYLSAIKQSLEPYRKYTGGYITVIESEDSKIVLKGYAEPNCEEAQIIIKKLESIAVFKPYWQRLGSGEPLILLSELHNLKLGATTVEETTEEAEQTIQGLVNLVNTIQSGIQTKAGEDLKLMFGLFDSAQKAAEINLQNFIKSSEKRDKQGREWFNKIIRGKIKKHRKLGATTVEEITKEAEQTIQNFVNFVNTLQSGIQSKAGEDVKVIFGLFDSARKAAEINFQNLIKSSENKDKETHEWFNKVISENFNPASNFYRTLSSFSQIWKDRMVKTIKSIDLQKSKDVVKKMQQQFPDQSPWQISTRLMNEKAIYAMFLGASGSMLPGAAVVFIDFLPVSKLLAEMIYQISVAYGFEKSEESETHLEILSVWLLVGGSKFLLKKGLDFMTSHIPAYGVAISASTTLILFQLIGYAACEFYEAKLRNNKDGLTTPVMLDLLEQKVEIYTEKLLSVEETFVGTAAKALAMKKLLAPG